MKIEHDDLAARSFTAIGGDATAGPDLEAQAAEEQEAQSMAQLEAGFKKVAFGILKLVRNLVEKNLPEIREEWSDPVLQGPVDPLVGVIKKYLPRVMDSLGKFPEIGLLAFSMLPLVMGYMAALEKHNLTVDSPAPENLPSNVTPIRG